MNEIVLHVPNLIKNKKKLLSFLILIRFSLVFIITRTTTLSEKPLLK